jgi:hypothetical protein
MSDSEKQKIAFDLLKSITSKEYSITITSKETVTL